MRIATTLTFLAAVAAAAPAMAGDQTYKVELNKTEIVRLPGAAGSIVVGNPLIADISVQSVDTIFVVGRGYGETNLIVLDAQGNTMMNANLQVVNSLSSHGVRVYNGTNRETYSCIPYCSPSPVLGDSQEFIGANTATLDPISPTTAFYDGNASADAQSGDAMSGAANGAPGSSASSSSSNGWGDAPQSASGPGGTYYQPN